MAGFLSFVKNKNFLGKNSRVPWNELHRALLLGLRVPGNELRRALLLGLSLSELSGVLPLIRYAGVL